MVPWLQEMVDKHAGETAKASSMLTEVNAAWQRDTKQWEDRLNTTKRMLEASYFPKSIP